MMKHLLAFILILFLPLISFSQIRNFQVYGGSSIGGPMPLKMADSSYANLKHGLSAGFNYLVFAKNQFKITAEMSYQFVPLVYGQHLRQDTSVQIFIPMQNGDTLSTFINTYYRAHVQGKMKLNYLKAGTNFSYKKNHYVFTLGTYLSAFTGGYDKGDVHVTIGEGGVAGLEDYDEKYHNNIGINRFFFEILLRTERQIYKNLALGLQLSRGITGFYKNDFEIRGEKMKFYNTIIGVNLVYNFL